MNSLKSNALGVGLCCALLAVVISCGKVTQEVAPNDTKERKDFTVTAVVNVVSSKNIASTSNTTLPSFSILDTTMYFAVSGILDGEAPEIMSWGQGDIEEEKDPSENITFKSIASNKNSVTITASNLKESLLSLRENRAKDPSGNAWIWSGRASKLKHEKTGYLVQFFTDKDKFQLVYLDETEVSGNTLISLETITPYDNFMATLVLTDLTRIEYALKDRIPVKTLKHLFTPEFYDNITYKQAPNTVSNFRLKTPQFEFKNTLETTLLKIVDTIHNTDKTEAEEMVRKAKWTWMNEKAKKELVAAITSYKLPESPVEVSTEENKSEQDIKTDDKAKPKSQTPPKTSKKSRFNSDDDEMNMDNRPGSEIDMDLDPE
ncbi:MAG: hypothetical protein O3A01_00415 [bacterium]|nr:hypothetical protein [bacterium]